MEDEFRNQVISKIDQARKTILVTSTWGEDSLLGLQGVELLNQVGLLANSFNVLLSLHPNCYLESPVQQMNMAESIESCHENGVIVIPPSGTSIFSLARDVDLLIADKSSFSLYFTLLEKLILMFDTPGLTLARVSPMRLL